MKIYEVLDKLQFEVENAANVPLTNKVMFDKDDFLDIIDDLREAIPEDIKTAKTVNEEENRIKLAAQREASNVIKEARETKQHLIDDSNITKNAKEEAAAIVRDAKAEANRLKLKGLEYVASLIDSAQAEMRSVLGQLEANKNELRGQHNSIKSGKDK